MLKTWLKFFIAGSKAKERISKRACAYQGVRNVCFSEILACFAFLKHPFGVRPFTLFPTLLTTFTMKIFTESP